MHAVNRDDPLDDFEKRTIALNGQAKPVYIAG